MDFAALAMIEGAARDRAAGPDPPGTERSYHVDDRPWNCLMVVREEHAEAGTRVLRRDCLPAVFAGTPDFEHRFILARSDSQAVDRCPVCRQIFCLSFEKPKDSEPKYLRAYLSVDHATWSL